MGAMIQYLKVPAFIATLTGMFFSGSALISRSPYHQCASMNWQVSIASDVKPLAYINFNVLVFLLMILIGAYLLQATRFGRNIYAIGGNEQSATLMGLPVNRTKVMVYGFNGLCSVLAGVAYVLYVKSGWNLSLQGAELDVISCVIGGTLLTGGVGYMFGTLFGVLLKSVIPALITFNGTLLSWWAKIATGILLLLFIGIQRIVVSASARKRH